MRAHAQLRCAFLGYLWRMVRALHKSSRVELLGVGLEPQRSRSPEAEAFCKREGVPCFEARRVDGVGPLAQLLDEGLDLLVVGAFGQILPLSVIDAPRLGTLNLHASRLPAYRGGWPIEWQILRGERRGGATLHWMVEEVDAGPIALCRELPIGERDRYDDVYARCHAAGEAMLAELLELATGEWPRTPQTPCPAPTPSRSRRDGVIDWRLPASEIDRLVRAEGWRRWVRSELDAGNLTVEEAEPLPGRGGRPGEVIVGGESPVVATGEGQLRLLRHTAPVSLPPGQLLPCAPRETI